MATKRAFLAVTEAPLMGLVTKVCEAPLAAWPYGIIDGNEIRFYFDVLRVEVSAANLQWSSRPRAWAMDCCWTQ
jgi:hypothetical protein